MAATRSRTSNRARRAPIAPTGELRDGFKFRGGRLALDLTASLAGRRREVPRDLLAEPRDLGRWLVAAGLTARAPDLAPADLEHARDLREAIYRLATYCIYHRAIAAADRAVINRWAALPAPAPQLTPDGGLAWIGDGVDAMFATIARDAVDLFGGPSVDRLRACASDTCAILFLDSSRAGQRRWCSMTSCGNKAKVSEFRRRDREAR
jgi:predicted RNA-binding Zn ribbon-like protein